MGEVVMARYLFAIIGAAAVAMLSACGGEDPATYEGEDEAAVSESDALESTAAGVEATPWSRGAIIGRAGAAPLGAVPYVGGKHPNGPFPGCDSCPIQAAPHATPMPAQ